MAEYVPFGSAPLSSDVPPDDTAVQPGLGATFGQGLRVGGLSARGQLSTLAGKAMQATGFDGAGLLAAGAEDQRAAQAAGQGLTPIGDVRDLSSGLRWASGAIGASTPMAALATGASLLGGRGAAGRMLAGTAAMTPFEMGEGLQRMDADPVAAGLAPAQQLRQSFAPAAGAALVQNLVPAGVAARLGGHGVSTTGRQILARGLADIPAEGLAEGAGEGIRQFGLNRVNPNAGYDLGAIGQSALEGAALGGVFGGVGAAGEAAHKYGGAAAALPGRAIDAAKGLVPEGARKRAGEALDAAGEAVQDAAGQAKAAVDEADIPTRLREFGEKAKTSVASLRDRIAGGQEIADPAEIDAAATPEAMGEVFAKADRTAAERVKEWGNELLNSALEPEKADQVRQWLATAGDKASQQGIAALHQAQEKTKAVSDAVSRFAGRVKARADELEAGGVKKSEVSTEASKALGGAITGVLGADHPALTDPKLRTQLADGLRSYINDVASGKAFSSFDKLDQLEALYDVAGDRTTALLNAVHSAVRGAGQADQAVFKTLNQMDAVAAGRQGLLDTLQKNLRPELQRTSVRSELKAEAEMLTQWARSQSDDPAQAERSKFNDNQVRAALQLRYGDKADLVMKAVQKSVKAEANMIAEQIDPEEGYREGDIESEISKSRYYAQKGQLYLSPEKDPGKAGFEGAAAQRLKKAQKDNPDAVVRFAKASELGRDHPMVKAKYEDLLDAAETLGMNPDEAKAYADKRIDDFGVVVAEQSKQETAITDNELDKVRLETGEFGKSPSRINTHGPATPQNTDPKTKRRIDGNIALDAARLTEFMQGKLKGDFSQGDDAGRPFRTARMFMEGVAAVQARIGRSFDIPDSTEITYRKNGQPGMTWGEARKLKQPTAGESTPAVVARKDDGSIVGVPGSARIENQVKRLQNQIDAIVNPTAEKLIDRMKADRTKLTKENVRDAYKQAREMHAEELKPLQREIGKLLGENMESTRSTAEEVSMKREADPFGPTFDALGGRGKARVTDKGGATNVRQPPRSFAQTVKDVDVNVVDEGDPNAVIRTNADGSAREDTVMGRRKPATSARNATREPYQAPGRPLNEVESESAPISGDKPSLGTPIVQAAKEMAMGGAAAKNLSRKIFGLVDFLRFGGTMEPKDVVAYDAIAELPTISDRAPVINRLAEKYLTNSTNEPPPPEGFTLKEPPSPKAAAAKKAALLKAASSGDPALLTELRSSDDVKGLQRAAAALAEQGDSRALDAAYARLRELVQIPDVAYGLQTKKYSLQSEVIHAALGRPGFAATHDSPHKFDGVFDWRTHALKGEGAMVYGAGTYLSTSDAVHGYYKKAMTEKVRGSQEQRALEKAQRDLDDAEMELIHHKQRIEDNGAFFVNLKTEAGSRSEAFRTKAEADAAVAAHIDTITERIADLRQKLKDGVGNTKYIRNEAIPYSEKSLAQAKKSTVDDARERLPELEKLIGERRHAVAEASKRVGQSKSPTYHLSVDIEPEQLMDWDKPFAQQSELVQNVLRGLVTPKVEKPARPFKWIEEVKDAVPHEFLPARGGKFEFDGERYYLKRNMTGRVFIYKDGETTYNISVDGATAADVMANVEKRMQHGPEVYDPYAALVKENADGQWFYRTISERFAGSNREVGDRQASDYLQSLGILGHRMKASAKDGAQNPNYVIYDDSKIRTNYVHFSRQGERQKLYIAEGGAGFELHDDVTGEWISTGHPLEDEVTGGYKTRADAEQALKDWESGAAFDKQGVTPGSAGPVDRKAVLDYIGRVLGNSVALAWKNILHAGEFERTALGDVIRLSIHSLNPMSTAYHEALHGFFAKLSDAKQTDISDVLEKAGASAPVMNQLKKLLANEPAALAQLSDPEERAAYMYQFWAQGKLTVGPKVETLFQRIAAFIRQVTGLLTNDERAVKILEAFHSGEYEKMRSDPNAVHRALMSSGAKGVLDKAAKMTQPLRELGETLASAGGARLRDTGIPALRELADAMKLKTTSEGDDPGFLPAARLERSRLMNQLGVDLKPYSEADIREATEAMQAGRPATGTQAKIVAKIVNRRLAEMLDYMQKAGVRINDLGLRQKDGVPYFPRSWDASYISAHQRDFLQMLEKYARSGQLKGDPKKVLQTLMVTDGNEFNVEVDKPGMQHAKARVLSFISHADAAPFMRKDLYQILNNYVTQATRRAEWARRFGDDGAKISALLDQAKVQGATPAQLKAAQQFVRAVDGTLGDTINPALRRLQGNVMVYENIRLLPLAIFSSLIDPAGIAVRGGTVGDAFSAFKRGMKEVVKNFQAEPKGDAMTELAEAIGTVDNAALVHAMGASYSQGMVGDTGRKINDTFFRLNLMEQFNNSMRVAATESALKFIARHAARPNEHSERYLKELGLTAADVQQFNGRAAVLESEGLTLEQSAKMKAAVNRWVDGAVLRPDAVDKPVWMSDPHFALVAHLKQFVFSFHETILKRVVHEAKAGNYTPAMALASYVPMMIAADYLKGIIQGGGQQPPWKDGWTAGDYVFSGMERAGLFGVGQFGLDMLQDARRGGTGIGALSGPAIEQLVDALQVLSGREQFGAFALKSLPANALYSGVVRGETAETDLVN